MDHGVLQTKSVYCTLLNKSDNSKYVCYSHTKSGTFNIGLTNASDVWSKDFTEEMLAEHGKNVALKSAEDYISKIRSVCGNGNASVTMQEEVAVLHLGVSPGSVSLTLPRLSEPEGREELSDLLFRMADSLKHADSAGGPSSFSPRKSQFKGHAGFEPRRQQTGPTVVARKRLPGDSLINPGSRKKKPATGVAFADDDDL